MRTLDVVVAILLVVGGLNWGLVGYLILTLLKHYLLVFLLSNKPSMY